MAECGLWWLSSSFHEAMALRASGSVENQRVVEALVPEATAEALHEGVLHGLAWRDLVPFDAGLLAPSQDRDRGQYGAVVGGPGLDPGSCPAGCASG